MQNVIGLNNNGKEVFFEKDTFSRSLIFGFATNLLFGPRIGLIAMLANLTLYALSKSYQKVSSCSWFSCSGFVNGFKRSFCLLPINVILIGVDILLFSKFGAVPVVLNQSPKLFLPLVAIFGLWGQFLEELVFRGFLQEKISDLQAFFTKGAQGKIVHKVTRAAIQAFIYAAIQVNCYTGLIMRATKTVCDFVFAFSSGILKEQMQESLWPSLFFHFFNRSVFLTVTVFRR